MKYIVKTKEMSFILRQDTTGTVLVAHSFVQLCPGENLQNIIELVQLTLLP